MTEFNKKKKNISAHRHKLYLELHKWNN